MSVGSCTNLFIDDQPDVAPRAVWVSQAVIDEFRRIIEDSEIMRCVAAGGSAWLIHRC